MLCLSISATDVTQFSDNIAHMLSCCLKYDTKEANYDY